MQIKNVQYDASSKVITLIGTASQEEAVAFLVGGQAMAAASVADVEAAAVKPAKGAKPSKSSKPAPAEEPEADDDEDDEDDEDDDDDEADDEDDAEEPPAKPAKGKGGKAAPAAAANKSLKITPAMKNASKLREVIEALIEQGVSKKDMVAACKALKEKIPVLGRVVDLEGRVPKAYEIVTAK